MIGRRTFTKLALSLLPAAWMASKVRAEPPKLPTIREKVTFHNGPIPDYCRNVVAFGDFGPHTPCIATLSDGSTRHCTIGDLGKCTVGSMTRYDSLR